MKIRYRSVLALLAAILVPSGLLFGFDSYTEGDYAKKQYWEDSYGGDGCSGSCGVYPCCIILLVDPE